MTQAYKNFSIIPVELLPSRQTFLDGAMDSPGMTVARLDLLNLYESGIPDAETVYLEVPVIHVQSIQITQQERMQTVINSSDDGQAYFFGRETRTYQVSAFIIDSDLSPGQGYKIDRTFRGHLLGRWKTLYETHLRVTQTTKNRRIVRIRFKSIDLYGHILSAVATMEASQPFLCQISIVFLCVYESDRASLPVINGGQGAPIFPGMLTREGWLRLAPDAPFRLVSGESAVEALASRRASAPPSD